MNRRIKTLMNEYVRTTPLNQWRDLKYVPNNNIQDSGDIVSNGQMTRRKHMKGSAVIAILAFLVILVSGIFKYQIIAIGSGSMSPLIEKGDAVIISKTTHQDLESIKVGQILVFTHNGRYITHRVIYITKLDGKYYFQTKGDANSDEDNYTVEEDDIIGVTSQRIKWIGLPTVWLQEFMNKEK